MEFKPYKINECFEHLYYQIPQELFFNPFYKDKLSSDSKILYGFLLKIIGLMKMALSILYLQEKKFKICLICQIRPLQRLLNN